MTEASLWKDFEETVSRQLQLNLDKTALDKLQKLYQLLVLGNEKLNLTRIIELQAVLSRHFLDSLSLAPYLSGKKSLIDVGSGAGFPALPLAIVFPEMSVTALEATGKKARFIVETGEALDLSNLNVVSERAEEAGQKPVHREKYDACCARAVSELRVLSELCLPFLKTDGHFYALKSAESASEEIKAAQQAIQKLGAGNPQISAVTLSGLENHVIIAIEKTRPTPSEYPRKPGIPAKKPL